MASGGSGSSDRFGGDCLPSDLVPLGDQHIVKAFMSACTSAGNPNQDTLKQTLKKELNENLNYKKVWDLATAFYRTNKMTYNDCLPKGSPEECYIAVLAYTMETPKIYTDFNDESRKLSKSNWAKFPYKSLWYYLTLAVPNIKGVEFTEKTTCYRGVNFHFSPNDYDKKSFWKTLFSDPDMTIFKGFTSFSLSRSVAEGFMRKYGSPCLIIVEGVPMAGNSIQTLSALPGEEEVLLYPWNCFHVVKLEKEGERQTLHLKHCGWRDMDRSSAHLPYTIQRPYQYDML